MKHFARIVLVAITAVSLASPSFAQPAKKAAAQSDTSLLQVLHDDAVAASSDAQANNDTIAKTCYDAIVTLSEAKLNAAQVTGGGALLVFQKVRDVTRLSSSPQGTQLIVGCAPLVQDAKINFVQFFAQIGGAVLLKGLIPIP